MAWNQSAFSQRLTRLLDERGWTQQRLADTIRTHRRNISRWQSSPTNHPSYTDIEAMARAFGVAPGWLAFGSAPNPEEYALLVKWRRLTPRKKHVIHAMVDEFLIRD